MAPVKAEALTPDHIGQMVRFTVSPDATAEAKLVGYRIEAGAHEMRGFGGADIRPRVSVWLDLDGLGSIVVVGSADIEVVE